MTSCRNGISLRVFNSMSRIQRDIELNSRYIYARPCIILCLIFSHVFNVAVNFCPTIRYKLLIFK